MSSPLLAPTARFRYESEKIKGSRFIACLAPASNEEDAQAFLTQVQTEFNDARHVCWAWRLGEAGELTRSTDDGEPAGSAGRPILTQIEGHDTVHCVLAVVRYFGGVKLGVGGLMRAYGGTAGKCLDRADLDPVVLKTRLLIEHDYSCSGAVESTLHLLQLTALEPKFAERVRFLLDVPRESVETLRRELIDRTAGQVTIAEVCSQET